MIEGPVLVDTGALIATFNPGDAFHEIAVEQFQSLPVGRSFTCWPVITEAAHYPAQRARLLDAIETGNLPLPELGADGISGIRQVIDTYHDQQIDLADAVLVHLANRENISSVFTFDRRHFSILRRSNHRPFRVLPESL